jgi:hypothetical protein
MDAADNATEDGHSRDARSEERENDARSVRGKISRLQERYMRGTANVLAPPSSAVVSSIKSVDLLFVLCSWLRRALTVREGMLAHDAQACISLRHDCTCACVRGGALCGKKLTPFLTSAHRTTRVKDDHFVIQYFRSAPLFST